MRPAIEWTFQSSTGGARYVREWLNPDPHWIALIAHGYGEHIGRYNHVAHALCAAGATVFGPDHEGHGRSDGEPVLIPDFEAVVDDLFMVATRAMEQYHNLPVVLIGHSMGGMIAARFAQRHGAVLSALVLSGPMFGVREIILQLLVMDPMPEIPLDPGSLSRDASVGKAYGDDPLVWHGSFKRPTVQAMASVMEAIQAGPSVAEVPMLWIHGESDMLVPAGATRPMVEHLKGRVFEERIYPGAKHEVFNEINHDEVLGDVIAFIRKSLNR